MLVILKIALSLNGFLDEGLAVRSILSNEEDRKVVSSLRSKVDAIIIGGGTFRNDNPSLLVYQEEDQRRRITENRPPHPLPVIIWGSKNSPLEYLNFNLFVANTENTRPVLVIAAKRLRTDMEKLPAHISVEYYDGDRISAKELIDLLQLRGIGQILVEGSGPLCRLFLEYASADIIRIAYRGKIFKPETAKGIRPAISIDLTENYRLDKLEMLDGKNSDSMYAAWYVRRGGHTLLADMHV